MRFEVALAEGMWLSQAMGEQARVLGTENGTRANLLSYLLFLDFDVAGEPGTSGLIPVRPRPRAVGRCTSPQGCPTPLHLVPLGVAI